MCEADRVINGELVCALEKELLEQARVNGMGGEREADLLGKVSRLEKELAIEKTKNHATALKDCRELFDDLVESSKAIAAQRNELAIESQELHLKVWAYRLGWAMFYQEEYPDDDPLQEFLDCVDEQASKLIEEQRRAL